MVHEARELKRWFGGILPLFLPVLIEQYFISFIAVLNTIMASRLGSQEISAIGSVGTLINTVNAIFIALGIGGTVLAAQYFGRGQIRRLNQGAGLGLLTAFAVSSLAGLLIFIFRRAIVWQLFGAAEPAVLDYAVQYLGIVSFYFMPLAVTNMAFGFLRGTGDVRTPMRISIVVNLFNLLLNYLLIYGLQFQLFGRSWGWPGQGVRGAAAAAVLSQGLGLILAIYSLVRGTGPLKLQGLGDFKPDRKILTSIFRISLPTGAEQLIFNAGLILIQTFIMTLSTAEVAANAIAGNLSFLIAAPALALMTITSTLVGQAVGEGNPDKARISLARLHHLSVLSFALMALIFLPGVRFFAGIYTRDAAAVNAAVPVIFLWLLTAVFTWPASNLIPNALRASGDVNHSAAISIASIFFQAALAYVLVIVLDTGVMGAWIATCATNLFRGIFYTVRRMGSKWLEQKQLD